MIVFTSVDSVWDLFFLYLQPCTCIIVMHFLSTEDSCDTEDIADVWSRNCPGQPVQLSSAEGQIFQNTQTLPIKNRCSICVDFELDALV